MLAIEKDEMIRVLHTEHAFSDRFIKYMLSRNIRVEEDLIDQLFNSTEKRLARTLLLLARYGKKDQPEKLIPKISQETLAEMIGTTRSRVNLFMNKFKKLGFIHTQWRAPHQQFTPERCIARLMQHVKPYMRSAGTGPVFRLIRVRAHDAYRSCFPSLKN